MRFSFEIHVSAALGSFRQHKCCLFKIIFFSWLYTFHYNFIFYSQFMTPFTGTTGVNLKLSLNKANIYQASVTFPHCFLSRKSFSSAAFETGMSIVSLTASQGLGKVDNFLQGGSLNPCPYALCAAFPCRQPRQPPVTFRCFSNSHHFLKSWFPPRTGIPTGATSTGLPF